MFFIRLYRAIPMLIVLAVVSGIIYGVSLLSSSKPQAKSNVLRFLNWACIILGVFFLIATLYAWAEHNMNVTELLGSFLVLAVVLLIIVQLCYRTFVKHYPNYAWKAQKAHTITDLEKFVNLLRTIFGAAKKQ